MLSNKHPGCAPEGVEQALRESEARLQSVMNSAPTILCAADQNGGANSYLTKPLDVDDFLATLERSLNPKAA